MADDDAASRVTSASSPWDARALWELSETVPQRLELFRYLYRVGERLGVCALEVQKALIDSANNVRDATLRVMTTWRERTPPEQMQNM